MVLLTTAVNEKPVGHPLNLGDEIFAVGSCFTDYIGTQFTSRFYPLAANPFGTVYHPLAMAEQMRRLLVDQEPSAAEVDAVHDLFVHDFFHGDFSRPDKHEALAAMVKAHATARLHLLRASTVVLTLGTGFGYRRLATGQIVANCHKRPASEFARQLIYGQDIREGLRQPIEKLLALNKNIILTVSPVRHVRDSLIDNQISKAQLVTACHPMRQDYSNVEYFPAYEILLDELRDYRFYADDLVHPSRLASDIIFTRFHRWAFAGKAEHYFEEATALKKRMAHRVQRPDSAAAGRFGEQTQHLRQEFAARYPFARLEQSGIQSNSTS